MQQSKARSHVLRSRECYIKLKMQTVDDGMSKAAGGRTARTLAPVHMEPMLSISTSDLLSLVTLPCFSPLCEGRDTTHISAGGAQCTAAAEPGRLALLLPALCMRSTTHTSTAKL